MFSCGDPECSAHAVTQVSSRVPCVASVDLGIVQRLELSGPLISIRVLWCPVASPIQVQCGIHCPCRPQGGTETGGRRIPGGDAQTFRGR